MLVVAFATLLVSHSLFPGRNRLPCPARAAGLATSSSSSRSSPRSRSSSGFSPSPRMSAMLPLFLIISVGGLDGWKLPRQARRASAREPRRIGAGRAGGDRRSTALCSWSSRAATFKPLRRPFEARCCALLVVSLPLAARLPSIAPLLASGSPSLYLVPPVWFLGRRGAVAGTCDAIFRTAGNDRGCRVRRGVAGRRRDVCRALSPIRPRDDAACRGVWWIPMACAAPRADPATALERRGHP